MYLALAADWESSKGSQSRHTFMQTDFLSSSDLKNKSSGNGTFVKSVLFSSHCYDAESVFHEFYSSIK